VRTAPAEKSLTVIPGDNNSGVTSRAPDSTWSRPTGRACGFPRRPPRWARVCCVTQRGGIEGCPLQQRLVEVKLDARRHAAVPLTAGAYRSHVRFRSRQSVHCTAESPAAGASSFTSTSRVATEPLDPGPFELHNIPVPIGAGDVEITCATCWAGTGAGRALPGDP